MNNSTVLTFLFLFFKRPDPFSLRSRDICCTIAVNTSVGKMTRIVTCLRNTPVPVRTKFMLFSRHHCRLKQNKNNQ